jgi:hypothetical protein
VTPFRRDCHDCFHNVIHSITAGHSYQSLRGFLPHSRCYGAVSAGSLNARFFLTNIPQHIPGGVILPHLGPTSKGNIDADKSVTDSLPSSASFWIWPSFVIWGFDRFIRMVRLVVFNHSYFAFKPGSGTMDATTELLSDDLVRVRLSQPHISTGPQGRQLTSSCPPFRLYHSKRTLLPLRVSILACFQPQRRKPSFWGQVLHSGRN